MKPMETWQLTPFWIPRSDSEANHLNVIPVFSCAEERIAFLSPCLYVHVSDGPKSVCLVQEGTSM